MRTVRAGCDRHTLPWRAAGLDKRVIRDASGSIVWHPK